MREFFIFYGSVFHNNILTVVLLVVTMCTLVGSNSW